MKIKVIMSDKAMTRATMDDRERMLKTALSSDAEVSVDCIKRGPDELDCNTDEAFAAAEMVKESIKAEKEGYDAIVIYCFSDVGIDAIRENVRIPVIGPGEVSLAAAHMLCNRITVLTSESINIPRTYRRHHQDGHPGLYPGGPAQRHGPGQDGLRPGPGHPHQGGPGEPRGYQELPPGRVQKGGGGGPR